MAHAVCNNYVALQIAIKHTQFAGVVLINNGVTSYKIHRFTGSGVAVTANHDQLLTNV